MSAKLTEASSHYAPISLAELVDTAALMRRVDRKYLLPAEAAAEVMVGLDPRSRVLEINGKRDFAYESMYFDTPNHLAYRLTAQERRRRFKLRTRSYVDTGGCYLEVKTKSGRGATVKKRTPCDSNELRALSARGREFVTQALLEEGIDAHAVAELRPSLASTYRRTTLLLAEGSRATFDSGLYWRSATSEPRDFVLGDHVIIETKSHGGVSELDRALWRSGQRPLGISKFGTGMAALHPELPHNKWARVLRHVFHAEAAGVRPGGRPEPGVSTARGAANSLQELTNERQYS